MNKPYLLPLCFLFLVCFQSFSQIPVGYQFDASGYPIDGYFDELSFQSDDVVRITHNSDSYEKGAIYDLDGNKTEGLVKYENKKILFKVNDIEYRDKIKPDSLMGLTVGVDSFLVIENFFFKGNLKTQRQFAQYITEVEGDVFVKYYKFNNVRLQGTPPITISYLGKKAGSNIWHELTDKGLKEHGHKYFGLVQDFNKRLEEGEFKDKKSNLWLNQSFGTYYGPNYTYSNPEPLEPLELDEVYGLIKELEYLHKYAKNEPIYFDSNWNELTKPNDDSRIGKIVDVSQDAWEIHYFLGSEKKYEINYSSLFPHERHGDLRAFHKGQLVKEISYQDDEPVIVTAYNQGQTLYEYRWITIKDSYGEEAGKKAIYKSVIGVNREDLLAEDLTTEGELLDPITNAVYYNSYDMAELQSSYRLEGSKKIYQVANNDQRIKLKKLQKDIIMEIETDDLSETLVSNAQGTVLIKVLINPEGKVDNYEMFGSIHPEFDRVLKDYIHENLLETAIYRIGFKPFKVNKEKVYLETYIPIVFTINRFYRATNNYYWHYDHMMMHQQMMMQSFTPPTPPPRPPSFY